MNSTNSSLGWLSLIIALVGIPISFLLGLGPFAIWGFELIALVIGFISRRTVTGKAGMIVAILISLLLFGYLTIGGVSTTTVSPVK